MTRNLVAHTGLVMTIILTASTLQAQEDLLSDLYGRGVHAYFAGKIDVANKLFSQAIDQDTEDPRCYYFRAITYTRLGRPEQATKDFQKGAQLETRDNQQIYAVNRSLQRVQGPVRLTLETHRAEARVKYRKYLQERLRVRYERLQEAEKEVLRGGSTSNPDNKPQLPNDAKIDPNNPFTGNNAKLLVADEQATPTKQTRTFTPPVATKPTPATAGGTTGTPVAQPAAQPAGANPFGGAPAAKPAAQPAGANPFGDAPAAKPAAQPPAQPAGANPFGDAPAAKPAAEPAAKPAAKPAAANPFGDAPAAKPAANPFAKDPK